MFCVETCNDLHYYHDDLGETNYNFVSFFPDAAQPGIENEFHILATYLYSLEAEPFHLELNATSHLKI